MNILLSMLAPVLGSLLLLLPPLRSDKSRRAAVLLTLFITLALNVAALVSGGEAALGQLAPRAEIRFAVDGVTRIFAPLIAFMWCMSGIFSFEYMKHEENHTRYYSFFLLGEGSMLGVAYAANYVTMYLSFEWMTLLTLPLVLHEQSEDAIKAGMKYLLYSFAGAFAGLIGIPILLCYGTTLDFIPGGVLDMSAVAGHEGLLLGIAFAVSLGFGAKAGLFPLHAWLPTAHPVAPAPASAVLSGVITKAGVIAILRVIYYQFGWEFLRGTWVQYALLSVALLTVFMGSSMAYREKLLKKRLAYSTVSQVSYILFGLFLMNATALQGALLHVFAHSVVKDGLFLCAGAIIYKSGKTRVDELAGIGREMPVTLWCYTLCSLALVGIPPMCGFMSKWYLALGSLQTEIPVLSWLGPVILLISALLTAAYLLPITVKGFFPGEDCHAPAEKKEPNAWMLCPLLLLAALSAFTLFPAPFMALIKAVTDIL